MLYIDLSKGKLNRGKLVKKPVLVRKDNGKTHIRNQWVNPTTGLPEGNEKPQKMNEAERWSTGNEKSTPRNKVKMYGTAHNITINSTEPKDTPQPETHKVARPTIQSFLDRFSSPSLSDKPKLSNSRVLDSDGVERTPFWNANSEGLLEDEVDDAGYLKEELLEERQTTVYPAPLSIRNYDTGLSEYEIDERCGMIGPIDMDNASVGTPYTEWTPFYEFLNRLDTPEEMDLYEDRWTNLFGRYSIDTLQSALAGEHGKIINIMPRYDCDIDGYQGFTLTMDLSNEKGEHTGSCIRTFYRDCNGTIHQYNDELDIKEQYQNAGIANDLYERQLQLTKHMSGGHAAYTHLTANISVGKYAWAGKGYDFKTQDELEGARYRLQKFCTEQGINTDDMLKECGYNSMSDLKHSWQFASLDNGKKYQLSDKKYTSIKGEGHFGKAFMLGGMTMWEGVLELNTGSLGEKLCKKSMK